MVHTVSAGDDEPKNAISQIQASKELETQAHTSYIGAQQSYLTQGGGPAQTSFLQSTRRDKKMAGRDRTGSPRSRYRLIPTENLKFNKFMDLLFNSKMEKTDMKDEITKYVQLLETNYN